MDPINYLAGVPQINLGQQFLGGLQAGAAIGSIENTAQKQQMELEQAKQYQTDLQAALANPTPQNFAAVTLKYPKQREAAQQAWNTLSEADRKAEGDTMAQAYSAGLAGKWDIAKQVVKTQIEARKNAGLDTSHYENALGILDGDPKQALGALGFTLSHINDPKTFAKSFGALGDESRTASLAPSVERKADAEAGAAEAGVTEKNLGIVAQKAGALAKPGVKHAQVENLFRSLAAQGVIPKDELQGYLDGMPSDAKALPDYLKQVQSAGLTAAEQTKYTTPTADASLSAETQVKTTGMNNATSVQTTKMNNQAALDREDRIATRMEAKGNAEASLDPETLTTMAQQYLAGDRSVMQNLGRGAQGSANIVALRKEITAQAKEKGLSGPQIAAQMADYAGLTAGLRTSANISARVENAISEAKELAPLAIEAGRNVSRSGFLPFGKIGVMFDTQTNNPELKKFATANNGLVSAYAGAMARGQKPTVSDYDHAREILSAPQSQPAYEATVNQMFKEMEAASRAPQNVREHLRGQIGGTSSHGAAPTTSAPSIPAGWSVREH